MMSTLTGEFGYMFPRDLGGACDMEMTDLHRTLRDTEVVLSTRQTVRRYIDRQHITVHVREDCAGQVRRLMADLGMSVLG